MQRTDTTSGLPPEATRPGRVKGIMRMLKAEGALLSAVLALVVLYQYESVAPLPFVAAFALALLPLPLLLAILLWTDRYEPEPRGLLVRTFLWGAGVATFVAIIINTVAAGVFGEQFAVTIGAPVGEEVLKALALLHIVRANQGIMDGIHDGILYAAMVGLGFAAVENVGYYVMAAMDGGTETLAATFVIRGVFSPLAHPVFTAMTGIGFGLAVKIGAPWAKVVFPAIGLALAIFLHHSWNSTETADDLARTFAWYLGLIVLLAVFSIASGWRQRSLLVTGLTPELAAGVLSEGEHRHLTRRGLHRRRIARRARKVSGDAQHAWFLAGAFSAELVNFRHKGHRMHAPADAARIDGELSAGMARAFVDLRAAAPGLLDAR